MTGDCLVSASIVRIALTVQEFTSTPILSPACVGVKRSTRHPMAGLLHAAKEPARVLRSVFGGAEEHLGVGVVVRDPQPYLLRQIDSTLRSHPQQNPGNGMNTEMLQLGNLYTAV